MKNEENKAPAIKQAELKLADISLSKTNPRKHFIKKDDDELAESVRVQGVIQPILVRPTATEGKYELVCGERRYRASVVVNGTALDRNTIPAVIRVLTDDQVLELQIIENLQRKDIHPMEEALGFKNLLDRKKWTQEEIAKRVGKSISYVAQRLKINDLIKEFQDAFFDNRMIFTTALEISAFSAADQKDIFKAEFKDEKGKIIINTGIAKKYTGNLNDAPFDTKNINLVKEMGACTNCRFNTANASLFPEGESKANCSNRSCFIKKTDLSFAIDLADSIKDPTIELVAESSYTEDKLVKKLTDDGQKVLIEHKNYDEDYVDDKPDLSEFEEELVTEDNEYGDYDTREEMMAAYNKAVAEWNKEIEKREADYKKGKSVKGFVVAGDNKGKYIYIKLRSALVQNNGKPAKGSAAAVKEKIDNGKAKPEEIKAEIKRLQDAEERKKEIQFNKQMPEYYKLIEEDKKFISDVPMTDTEKRAAIIALAKEVIGWEDEYGIYKLIGNAKLEDEDDGFESLYKYLLTKKAPDLSLYLQILLRAYFRDKLAPGAVADDDGKSKVMIDVVKQYHAKGFTEITNTYQAEQLKREARLQARIDELNKELGIKPKEKDPVKDKTYLQKPSGDEAKKVLSSIAKKSTAPKKKVVTKKAAIKKAVKKVVKKAAAKKTTKKK